MASPILTWLKRLQGYDLEGTALSFLVCQVTLALVAAAAGTAWMPDTQATALLFLPTVLLAAFFLRLVDGVPLVMIAFLATWYFIVPPQDSFALNMSGAFQLALFVGTASLLILGVTRLRRKLQRRLPIEAAEASPVRQAAENPL
jgi:K+-sensing histidine kinase KdpD